MSTNAGLNTNAPTEGFSISRTMQSLFLAILGAGLIGGGAVWISVISGRGDNAWKNYSKAHGEPPVLLILVGIIFLVWALTNVMGMNKKGKINNYTLKGAKTFFANNAIIISLLAMVIGLSIIDPRFIKLDVIRDIVKQASPKLIVALGVSFVLLTGGTDLSAGRLLGLSAVISASLVQSASATHFFFGHYMGTPIVVAVLLGVGAALLCGLINGFMVSKLNLPPFIATLAMQVFAYGVVSIYFDMPTNKSTPIGSIEPAFAKIGQLLIGGQIPILIPIALVFAVIVWFVQTKTVFGKNIYAVGGNREAAKVSGVNVALTLLICYAIGGLFYGIGGVLEASRSAAANNNYGMAYELDAIASCVVGGVSLNGGIGKISGVIIGVMVFTVINYGLVYIGLNPFWQQVAKGVIIAVAVALDIQKYQQKT